MPAIAIVIGAIIKYISNYILIPYTGILGAAYSTIICYFVASLIAFIALNREIPLKLKISKVIFKPVLASITMGIVAFYSHKYILGLLNSNTVATLGAVAIAIAIYTRNRGAPAGLCPLPPWWEAAPSLCPARSPSPPAASSSLTSFPSSQRT